MRVNNNIFAQNSYRNLFNTSNKLGKSLEKLSSGLRINRAADDAAGLGISEKLRSQISGLEVAISNSQDGISLIQTAEGALDRTHAILRRVRDLTEASANGDKTDDDRSKYQAEVDQLLSEVDRISTTTEYNTKKLLSGALGSTIVDDSSQLDDQAASASGATADASFVKDATVTGTVVANGMYTITLDSDIINDADKLTNDNYAAVQSNGAVAGSEGTTTLYEAFVMDDAGGETETLTFAQPSIGRTATVTLADSDTINEAVSKMQNAIDEGGLEIEVSYNAADEAFQFEATKRGDLYNFYVNAQNSSGGEVIGNAFDTDFMLVDTYDTDGDGIYTGDGDALDAEAAAGTFDVEVVGPDGSATTITSHSLEFKADFDNAGAQAIDNQGIYQGIAGIKFSLEGDDVATYSYTAGDYKAGIDVGGTLTLQGGPNKGDDHRISVAINDMGSNALGVAGLDISTQSAAQGLMDSERIDEAIRRVSDQRGKLGAFQNRLEHTIQNLGVTKENLAASESRIRDADMAKEMMDFTKNQIMQQAGIAMLAQSNLSSQAVLQLLG